MPTIPSIRTSVENKDVLVLDNHAKNGTFERDARGRLIAYSGGFSVVYPYKTTNGEMWAFRCWHSDIKNSKKRYETISNAIKKAKLSFLCQFQYIDQGINVEGKIYPITRMRWIDGINIKDYICQNKNSKDLLIALAKNFLKMTQALHALSLAHGDLQHGNILVDKNHHLHLVDYDSFYCPQLKGEPDTVTGLADYQHPSRSKNKSVSEKLDYFSELIIYLSILAIAENPSLADKYKVEGSERLLFSKNDYSDIKNTEIYKDIQSLGKKFSDLLDVLDNYLKCQSIDSLQPFDVVIDLTARSHNGISNHSANETPDINPNVEELKAKYGPTYNTFIRYHYNILDKASKGDAEAQYEVGNWFYERDSKESLKTATFWYIKAARQNHVDAQIRLARCYEEGIGVCQNENEAMEWYEKASSNGNIIATQKYLKLKYREEEYKNVIRYRAELLKAADKGNPNSQFLLGEWFRIHNRQLKYSKEAFVWYSKAAKKNHGDAMLKLAECYENGFGVPIDNIEAIKWYKKAAKSGNKIACIKLAESYLHGNLVNKDTLEAIKWFEQAKISISGDDLCSIGYAYEVGDNIHMNKKKAIEYYLQAAEKGNANALYKLGVCYENGIGVSKNAKEALSWYEKAKDKGHKKAEEAVLRIEKNLYYENQGLKETLCFYIAGFVFFVGIIIYYSAPNESWLKQDTIGWDNGVLLFSVVTYLSYEITRKILGVK